MTELRRRTQEEVGELFESRTVAILPMGSTEPHGPHLPIDTDVILAEAMAHATAEGLGTLGVKAIVLPAVPYGVTRLAQDFPGGVTLRPGTLWAVVEDMLLSLSQDGVGQLLLCNAHQEWEQRRVLENLAVDYVRRGPGHCQVLYPSGSNTRLEEVECHGGQRETSLMLHVAPDRVRTDLLGELEPVEFDLPAPQRAVNRSLAKLGVDRGYCGDPASASAQEGGALLGELAAAMVESCREAWPDLFLPG